MNTIIKSSIKPHKSNRIENLKDSIENIRGKLILLEQKKIKSTRKYYTKITTKIKDIIDSKSTTQKEKEIKYLIVNYLIDRDKIDTFLSIPKQLFQSIDTKDYAIYINSMIQDGILKRQDAIYISPNNEENRCASYKVDSQYLNDDLIKVNLQQIFYNKRTKNIPTRQKKININNVYASLKFVELHQYSKVITKQIEQDTLELKEEVIDIVSKHKSELIRLSYNKLIRSRANKKRTKKEMQALKVRHNNNKKLINNIITKKWKYKTDSNNRVYYPITRIPKYLRERIFSYMNVVSIDVKSSQVNVLVNYVEKLINNVNKDTLKEMFYLECHNKYRTNMGLIKKEKSFEEIINVTFDIINKKTHKERQALLMEIYNLKHILLNDDIYNKLMSCYRRVHNKSITRGKAKEYFMLFLYDKQIKEINDVFYELSPLFAEFVIETKLSVDRFLFDNKDKCWHPLLNSVESKFIRESLKEIAIQCGSGLLLHDELIVKNQHKNIAIKIIKEKSKEVLDFILPIELVEYNKKVDNNLIFNNK